MTAAPLVVRIERGRPGADEIAALLAALLARARDAKSGVGDTVTRGQLATVSRIPQPRSWRSNGAARSLERSSAQHRAWSWSAATCQSGSPDRWSTRGRRLFSVPDVGQFRGTGRRF